MSTALHKCLALVFSLLVLGQAYAMRRYVGTWLCPACLFGLFWFFLTFGPLIVLFTVPIYPYATALILACALSFSSSAFLFSWVNTSTTVVHEKSDAFRTSRFLRTSFYLISAASLGCAVLNSAYQGMSLRDLLFDTITTAVSYRDLWSRGDLNVTWYLRLAEILAYLGAMLGGMLISAQKTAVSRTRVLCLSFLCGAYMAVAQSSKWTLFSCVALFYGGILTSRIAVGECRLVAKGSVKRLAISAVILFSIATASFMSRGLHDVEDSDFIADTLRYYFASYSSGHLYAFSDWFAFRVGAHSEIRYTQEQNGLFPGSNTFPSIIRPLGGAGPDNYDDYYAYKNVLTSNMYTIFRGLIEDFGLIGSVFLMFLAGIPFHWAFRSMQANQRCRLAVVVFMFSTAFIYSSYDITIFNWSWIYFSFPLLWLILVVDSRLGSIRTFVTKRGLQRGYVTNA